MTSYSQAILGGIAAGVLLAVPSGPARADLPECSDRKVEREIKNGFGAA